ncbi:MAG: hypothetical protein ABI614_00210 [Planctomycetota bacterium]
MNKTFSALILSVTSFSVSVGCGNHHFFRTEAPLGSISDDVWRAQEHNAEASDFVLYQHEFKLNEVRLNTAGEDHVKQIAERISNGDNFPVVIERSNTTARLDTDYKFPVHPNPELDMQRRKLIVNALVRLGVPDADERVVVAPAFAEGFQSQEAMSAYGRGFSLQGGQGGGGFGGGGGGFGGGGFF